MDSVGDNGAKAPMASISIVAKVSQDDGTENSPEPSPNGPPMPTVFSSLGRSNNKSNSGYKLPSTPLPSRQHFLDDGSFSTLPDLPSPYSPPPSSLFSKDDWAQPPVDQNTPHVIDADLKLQGGNHFSETQSRSYSSRAPKETNSMQVSYPFTEAISTMQNLQQLRDSPYAMLSHRSTSSRTADRSHILPSVVFLKNSLQESHQAQYLLRQENRALVLECDRFQQEFLNLQGLFHGNNANAEMNERSLVSNLDQLSTSNNALVGELETLKEKILAMERNYQDDKSIWQGEVQKLNDTNKETENQRREVVQALSSAKIENEKISNDLLLSEANQKRAEEQNKKLSDQATKLEENAASLRSKLKSQTNEQAKILKEKEEEHREKLSNLQKEKTSASYEILKLQAMLAETKMATKQLTNEKEDAMALQTRIDEMEKELRRAQKENLSLQDELFVRKETTQQEYAKLEDICAAQKLKIDQLNHETDQSNVIKRKLESEIESCQNSYNDCLHSLEVTKKESLELGNEANRLQQELVKLIEQNNELKLENDQLHSSEKSSQNEVARVESLLLEKEEQLRDVTDKLLQFESQRQQYEGDLARIRDAIMASETKESELSTEVDRLVAQVAILANERTVERTKAEELRMELDLLRKAPADKRNCYSEVGTQTDSSTLEHSNTVLDDSVFGSSDKNPLAEYFTRVQESAEKAALINEYRQELARVKNEYEKEIKFLSTNHDQSLKEILHDAKLELKSRIEENHINVDIEVQKSLQEARRVHEKEIENVSFCHDFVLFY